MKLRIKKFSLNPVIASVLLVFSFSALSVKGETNKSLHIEANTQFLDIQGGMLIFTGNVIVTHGSIKINADKVVVTRLNSEKGKEIMDGYGTPAVIYQVQDDGELAKGYASHMHYELAKDLVILTGNAQLEKLGSSISGDQITYLVKANKIQVCSEKGRRVTAVLIPSQFRNQNKGYGLRAEEK